MRAAGAGRHWRHPGWERKVRNPLLLTSPGAAMLAKRTSKNQLTLPKAIVQAVGEAEYYDVSTDNGRIVLTPVRLQQADAVRAKLSALGIDEDDITDALAWSRKAG